MEKVLITGCSSGFGYQTALLLADHGFDVTATTRNPNFDFRHPNITSMNLDVCDLPERMEDYDIVVFNAGVLDCGLAEYMDDKSIDHMISVNVASVMKLCGKVIPSMKQKGKGKLIFMSSMAALRPLPNLSVYNATKAAIDAYAKSLYLELAPFHIDVYLIEPSFYKTNLWDNVKASQDEYEEILKKFGEKNQNHRDMKEVTFQILKICEGKKKALHHTFSLKDKLVVACKPLIYSKIGKTVYQWAIFKFQKMKTQK